MPLIRKLATGLWEVRSHISTGIARVMFTVDRQMMVLLHGFQKKIHIGSKLDDFLQAERLLEAATATHDRYCSVRPHTNRRDVLRRKLPE